MRYREMRKVLLDAGYKFDRQCAKGTHEFWVRGNRKILVTRSGLVDTRAKQNWLAQLRRRYLAVSGG